MIMSTFRKLNEKFTSPSEFKPKKIAKEAS
jgi:hypothetical protein